MSRSGKNEGYRGWREGDRELDGSDTGVKAGEARKGSSRGTERRLPIGVGDRTGANEIQLEGLDNKLRRRLAEALSSAGVDASRVAVEVLYLLPPEFVRGYEDLFHRALRLGDEGRGGRDDAQAELGKARKGAAKAPKKTRGGAWAVKDDRALGEKERVDRQLRKIARSLRDQAGAGTGKETVARCGGEPDGHVRRSESEGVESAGCGKWVEVGWKYCPHCGNKN